MHITDPKIPTLNGYPIKMIFLSLQIFIHIFGSVV